MTAEVAEILVQGLKYLGSGLAMVVTLGAGLGIGILGRLLLTFQGCFLFTLFDPRKFEFCIFFKPFSFQSLLLHLVFGLDSFFF